MYHYQKNIGDYRSATMHFSLLEHGIYNQLLDWYYLEEAPIPADNRTLFRRLSAKTEEEQKAVLDVLSEMFVKSDLGWVHKRVEREIAQYKARADQAREAGKLGGRPLKKGIGSTENRDGSEKKATAKPTANRKPITNNQLIPPIPPKGVDGPPGFAAFWSEWPKSTRKGARGGCLRAWERAGAEAEAEQVLAHVRAMKASHDWRKDGGQFIPAPLTYVNQRRWQGTTEAKAKGGAWFVAAGFANEFEANNERCFEHNAHEFRDGKRTHDEVTA